jgi:hypothetical protein
MAGTVSRRASQSHAWGNVPFRLPLAELHLTARDRQIRNCAMIHTTTTATISAAMTQFMTIAHIVANACSTDEGRRRMRTLALRQLDCVRPTMR